MFKNTLLKQKVLSFQSTKKALNIFSKVENRFVLTVNKNFSETNLKIKYIKPNEASKIEYKDLYFHYKNIEYRSQIPKNIDTSIGDFLKSFAKDQSVSTGRKVSNLDYEVSRAGHYLPQNLLINKMRTEADDKNPLLIFEDKLTLNNIQYRKLNHLHNTFETNSQTLQGFLNTFIESIKVNEASTDPEGLKSVLRSLGDVKSNRTKQIMALGTVFARLKTVSEGKASVDFLPDFHLDMLKFDKTNKQMIILRNKEDGRIIPINLVQSLNENQRKNNFNSEILDNFDSLRRVALHSKRQNNFGIVTDFYNWKFNYLRRDESSLLETEKMFLTSVKYNLPAHGDHVEMNSYTILLKVLTGISTYKQDFNLSL